MLFEFEIREEYGRKRFYPRYKSDTELFLSIVLDWPTEQEPKKRKVLLKPEQIKKLRMIGHEVKIYDHIGRPVKQEPIELTN